jgi:hypothetical protein
VRDHRVAPLSRRPSADRDGRPEGDEDFFVGPAEPQGADGWHAGNWHRGVGWYERHFDAAAPVRGEASPGYTSPSHPEAAERIAALVPDARLVLLVRDPVARAVSQYRHHHAEGTETRPVAEALLDPASQYLDRSRYAARLAPYLERFAPEQVHVLLQEDLLGRRRETLAGLYRFAGVDDRFWDGEALGRRHHVRTDEEPPLDPALLERVAAALAPDVARLRELTGRDLREWPHAQLASAPWAM